MIPRPPVSTRTYTLFPHTTLFRSNPPLPATTPREKPPMPRRLLPLALALASASAFAQAPAPAAAPSPPLTLAQVMADPDWIGNAVEDFWWAWDSRAAQFERKREGTTIRDTWQVPVDGSAGMQRVDDAARAGLDASGAVYDATRTRLAFVRNGDVFVRGRKSTR